ncbi:amidohydrolase [Rubrobacter xylanophilus DSM 9941]|uniref:Amidohydrolase n=1 Tax=Rubrobacter xylanophilus (strain DSM 9941 / JCM 11954 / NBRC 16129 / PRD-1) TaxID=266117 RepID=Q1ARN2_RUBXD|nr:amidohydrolase family protein [Rubrobacter xylanophilus]ABG05946.1 amidohydrolase [Rubrobacter xylanophilus DSM 9941]
MNPERILLRCDILIVDALSDPIYNAAILIEDGHVESVGDYHAMRRSYPLASEHGKRIPLAMPGLVDGHSHGRGISTVEQGIADAPLDIWLTRITAATAFDPYDEALVSAAELITTGVTTVQVIFHSFSKAEDYVQGVIATAKGFKQVGVGLELVLGISDQHEFIPPVSTSLHSRVDRLLSSPERGMDPTTFFEMFDALSGLKSDTSILPTKEVQEILSETRLVLGPIAPQWSSENLIQGIADRAAQGVRVHTHLLECKKQRSPLYGPLPVQKLDQHELLSNRTSVAHGVWLEPDEIALLAARKVSVVHCAGSNTRLEVGLAPVREMLDAGVLVAIGLDSNTVHNPPDIFAEMRHALEVASARGSQVSEREVLAMATSGGAAAIGRQDEVGTLRPGSRADLVILTPTEPLTVYEDPISWIVGEASRNDLHEVWVEGKVLYSNGCLRNSSIVATARRHLYEALLQDAVRRRERLKELRKLEPWLRGIWEKTSTATTQENRS